MEQAVGTQFIHCLTTQMSKHSQKANLSGQIYPQ